MEKYFETRLDPKHRKNADKIWAIIAQDILSRLPQKPTQVLDLGAGYGDFINGVQAPTKYAVDAWPGFLSHLQKGVNGSVGDITAPLSQLPQTQFDLCFLSNVMEHFTIEDGQKILKNIKGLLKKDGCATFLQPNFTYCSKNYFDDYTHKTIYTAEGFKNFLQDEGFMIVKEYPRYLPFSFKSRIPKPLWLIKLYLMLPFKPLAAQMLFIVKQR